MNATLRTAAIAIVAGFALSAATAQAGDWQTINRFVGWGYSDGYHSRNACPSTRPVVEVQAPCATCGPMQPHVQYEMGHYHMGRNVNVVAPLARPAHAPAGYRHR